MFICLEQSYLISLNSPMHTQTVSGADKYSERGKTPAHCPYLQKQVQVSRLC